MPLYISFNNFANPLQLNESLVHSVEILGIEYKFSCNLAISGHISIYLCQC